MDQASFPVGKKPWYKTSGGIVFLSFAIPIFLVFLGFCLLVVKNIWILRFGDASARAALTQKLGKNFTAVPNSTSLGQTVDQDTSILARPHNPTFGNAAAPVSVYFFIDFECPYSQDTYRNFEQIRSRFSPATRFVFKHFPIDTIHPRATPTALATECAQEQGRFWEYYQLLFERKDLSPDSLLALAGELSLNTAQFKQCLDSAKYQSRIDQDLQDGVLFGVRGTPTYIINNTRIEGVQSLTDWNKIILQALNAK